MDNIKGENIPEGVVNVSAYKTLIAEEAKLKNDLKRYYNAKTADFTLDLHTPYAILLRQIDIHGISEEEGEIILKKAKEVISKRSLLGKYRRAAFKGNPYLGKMSLLEPKKEELVALFGSFHSITEVHKIITVDWGLDMTYQAVERFRNANLEVIQVEQDKYVKDWSNLKLVHKRGRLDELTNLYEGRKQRYEETRSKEDYRLLLQTLEAIRKEIEGDRLTVDGGIEVNVQNTINLHIQQDILRNVNILQFIIARVAVRMSLNPVNLMQRLEKSYYAKFTGFALPDNNMNTDEIYYPSREMYDFTKINNSVEEAVVVEELPKVSEDIEKVSNDLKSIVLRKKRELIESEKRINEAGIGNTKIKPRRKKVIKKTVKKKGKVSGKK